MTVLIDSDDRPVEIAEGRGDLRYSSETFMGGWDGSSFFGGRPVSYAKTYASQPWVAIAVMRLLTWAIRVPLKAYERLDSDGDKRRLMPGEHELAAAIENPWPRGSRADLTMNLLGPKCVHGNALINVEEGARGQLRFEPLDWRTVMPNRLDQSDPNSEILGWRRYLPAGGFDDFSASTVMHLKWWSPLGNVGVSPLRQLQPTIAAESAAMAWQLNSLKQGVRPHGVVEMTDELLGMNRDLRKEIYGDAVEAFRANYGGERNAGVTPIMPPGMKWAKAENTTAVEAELISQRAANRNEVAALYMLPPPTIGQLERATFNNIVELRQMAYTDGLAPPLVLIEHLINAHLVRDLLRDDNVFVEFDLGLILRGDRLKEIKALREGVASAIYTPNEARGALNLPQSKEPEADQLFIPSNNLKPLGSGEGESTGNGD